MRIAHLTDLHLRRHLFGTSALATRRSREMPQIFQAALEEIVRRKPDFLAVTGDLLDVPLWLIAPSPGFHHDDPAEWYQAAVDDYQLIKSMLDRTGLPYSVLPGNHDWPAAFWQVFDKQDNTVDLAGHRIARFCEYEHDGHKPHRFIPERARFDQLLGDASSPPQVHLQHYVIAPHLPGGYPMNYAEHAYLTKRIGESGRVRLCLSGHHHAGTMPERIGSTTFAVTPGLCTWPHPWRMYHIEGEAVQHEDFSVGEAKRELRSGVVFLDRDGVINDKARFHAGPEAMQLQAGSAAAIRKLNDAGRQVIVVTNQNGVGRGLVPLSVVRATHDTMSRLLAQEAGAHVDAIYAALDAGSEAALPGYDVLLRSKPQPAMFLEAREQLGTDLDDAWMVGDNITDARAALAAGPIRPILVRTGHGESMAADFSIEFPDAPIVADLAAAVQVILAHSEAPPLATAR